MMLSINQMNWLCRYQHLAEGSPHPREYIHGIVFLFREPWDTAALSYDLSAFIVWNPALIAINVVEQIETQFRKVVSCPPIKWDANKLAGK
jgi:hypothetical protein